MNIQKTELLNEKQLTQIRHLWNKEYPVVINHESNDSLNKYLSTLINKRHILLIDEYEDIKGWFIDFDRENEKWFIIIVDSEIQGRGFGKILIKKGQELNKELNGWVVKNNDLVKNNGSKYLSPITFYLKNGFDIHNKNGLSTEIMTTIKISWKK